MKRYQPLFSAAIFAFVASQLTACATLSSSDCPKVDWNRVGRADGARGYAEAYFKNHLNACENQISDENRQTYLEGRKDGLKEYCSPVGAYTAGLANRQPVVTCPPEQIASFQANYQEGAKVRILRNQKAQTDAELQNVQDQGQADGKNGNIVGHLADFVGFNLKSGTHEEALERESADLSLRLADEQAHIPVGASSVSSDTEQAMAPAAGAMVGTVIGFGVGHAIQGRYAEKGWEFTVTQAAAIGLMAGATSICGADAKACSNALIFTGVVGLITSKVFETIDLWSHLRLRVSGYAVTTAKDFTQVAQISLDF